MTFIIDTDAGFEKREERKAIEESLKRFKSNLQESSHSQLMILDLKDKGQVHMDRTKPRFVPVSELSPTVWGRSDRSQAVCLKCVMNHVVDGINSLHSASDDTSELVIITEGKIEETEYELETIAKTIEKRNISLKVILYPYYPFSNIDAIRQLVSKVKGVLYLVPYSPSHLSNQMKLFDAFDSVMPSKADVLISRKEFDPSVSSVEFQFDLDQSVIGSNTEVIAQLFSSSHKEDLSSPSFSLTSPNRSREFTTKSREFREKEKGFFVSLKTESQGSWKLHYDRQSNDSVMIASTYIRTHGKEGSIKAKCILTEARSSAPPAVHVIVSQSGHPHLVQGAHVDVTLTDDRGNVLSNGRNLQLFDDGLANPDVTQGDGIYSRYLTEVNRNGFYGAQVRIRSGMETRLHTGSTDVPGLECCGSSVPKPTRLTDSKGVYHLERIINCGFLYVNTNFNPEDHVFRISDLKVESVDAIEREVEVSYSSPLTSIETISARLFQDEQFDQIRSNFEKGIPVSTSSSPGHVSSPSSSFHRRNHAFGVSYSSAGIYHLAIKVTGINGRSTISNIVTFFMPADPATLTTEGKDFSSPSFFFIRDSIA